MFKFPFLNLVVNFSTLFSIFFGWWVVGGGRKGEEAEMRRRGDEKDD